jgi:hypothetical protein
MSFERRCFAQYPTSAGVVTIVSAKYLPVASDAAVEIIIDNNFFVRVCRGDAEFVDLVQRLSHAGHRINPMAAILEQLTSNHSDFGRKYNAFRRHCEFQPDYEEFAFGGREKLLLEFLSDSYRLNLLILRCYCARAATIVRVHRTASAAVDEFRTFLSQQPACHPSIALLLMFCMHVQLTEREFSASSELSLITKFMALPQQLDIVKLRNWATNRAADLYLILATQRIVHSDSHLGDPLPGGVAVASSDQFVADVLFRYCCVGETAAKQYSIDLDELVKLDPNLFDALTEENMTWAHSGGDFVSSENFMTYYRTLWDTLALEAVAAARPTKQKGRQGRSR